VVRVADRLVVSLPAEPTVEVGRRARAAVQAAAGGGIAGSVVSGLANEYVNYLTTPQEYDRQHYEGGSTVFGPASSALLREALAELARRMARGLPAQSPYPFDPRNGVIANGAPFGAGAGSAAILEQPRALLPRGVDAVLGWKGGPRGLDKPLDVPFVTIQRRVRGRWRRVADDLGLQIVWTVDDEGRHLAFWRIPGGARAGLYRIVVTANRYRLVSRSFRVDPAAPRPPADPRHPERGLSSRPD
jgi:hypothetical protein